jgi:copper oxidase (laccase) domain-containing protein
MKKTILVGDRVVHFTMLGTATGGYNPKYSDDRVAIKRNLDNLGGSFGSTSSTLTLPQCHSTLVDVGADIEQATGDALLTTDFNHALLLLPADCIPLLLYSDELPLLALVHGSRQGLDEKIIEKSIDSYVTSGCPVASIHAYIGPCIQKESYLLPISIKDQLTHASWPANITKVGEQLSVDISGFAKNELLRLGLLPQNISRSTINTATDTKYYSHYRATRYNQQNGRNGVAVSQTRIV